MWYSSTNKKWNESYPHAIVHHWKLQLYIVLSCSKFFLNCLYINQINHYHWIIYPKKKILLLFYKSIYFFKIDLSYLAGHTPPVQFVFRYWTNEFEIWSADTGCVLIKLMNCRLNLFNSIMVSFLFRHTLNLQSLITMFFSWPNSCAFIIWSTSCLVVVSIDWRKLLSDVTI